jgi:hypothetical protein
MKIYTLPLSDRFRPGNQPFKYPEHNNDYGVEQDFFEYINNHPDLKSGNPKNADWHYLPIYWTRWHLNHDYAQSGNEELQREVNQVILDDKKTFTICQYDDGPIVDLGKSIIFISSRKGEKGIDIPLLSSPHKLPYFKPAKKYLASFIGRLSTHPIRGEMAEALADRTDVNIDDGEFGKKFFVKKMLESYIALAPRGYGGSSFRFFEAMQLGRVPFLIGDIDTRPFKKFINWRKLSLYADNVENIEYILDQQEFKMLELLGRKNSEFYRENLAYQRWCKYVIMELLEKQNNL